MTKKITFAETIQAHADRLGVSYNFARIRREVLRKKLQGEPLRAGDDIPWAVATASIPHLENTLLLSGIQTRPGVEYHPLKADFETDDLAHGRLLLTGKKTGGIRFGGEGQSRTTLTPPYGYRQDERGNFVSDPPAGEAIALAFDLIANRHGRQWALVAAELNARQFRRKDGSAWRSDDVRTLIRVPTYAGYIKQKRRALYRADFIPEPLVPVSTFYQAARLGAARKGMAWLAELEKFRAGGQV